MPFTFIGDRCDETPVIRVIDMAKIGLKYTDSWAMASAKDVVESLYMQKDIGNLLQEDITKKWEEISKKRSLLRILKNGEIKCVNANYFDQTILDCIKIDGITMEMLFRDVVGKLAYVGQSITDYSFDYRINELLKAKKLIKKNNKIYLA